MNPMVNPGMAPMPSLQPAQTPHSQYLAAALKQLSAQAPATPAALGLDLGASGLMQMAQRRDNSLAQSLAGGTAASTPAARPFSGLMGLGSMFGGPGG